MSTLREKRRDIFFEDFCLWDLHHDNRVWMQSIWSLPQSVLISYRFRTDIVIMELHHCIQVLMQNSMKWRYMRAKYFIMNGLSSLIVPEKGLTRATRNIYFLNKNVFASWTLLRVPRWLLAADHEYRIQICQSRTVSYKSYISHILYLRPKSLHPITPTFFENFLFSQIVIRVINVHPCMTT